VSSPLRRVRPDAYARARPDVLCACAKSPRRLPVSEGARRPHGWRACRCPPSLGIYGVGEDVVVETGRNMKFAIIQS